MEHRATWQHASGRLPLDEPQIMAVVNLTPDSFSDGGKLMADDAVQANVSVALRRCEHLVAQGAQILDLGGESTRPGAEPVGPQDELARVLPVLRALVGRPALANIPISVDTRHGEVARATLAAGAHIVNDISGLADPALLEAVARSDAGLVIGHLRGEPRVMQEHIAFANVLAEVADELGAAVERALAAGIGRARILVDPGIGFGKTAEQSAALVAAGAWLQRATGCAVLIGASRKAFLEALLPASRHPRDRVIGSVAAALAAAQGGAAVVRVHDVRETAEALGVVRGVHRAFERVASALETRR